MKASTINGTTFKLFKKGSTTKVGATVSYNASMDRAKLNPNNSLKSGVSLQGGCNYRRHGRGRQPPRSEP